MKNLRALILAVITYFMMGNSFAGIELNNNYSNIWYHPEFYDCHSSAVSIDGKVLNTFFANHFYLNKAKNWALDKCHKYLEENEVAFDQASCKVYCD